MGLWLVILEVSVWKRVLEITYKRRIDVVYRVFSRYFVKLVASIEFDFASQLTVKHPDTVLDPYLVILVQLRTEHDPDFSVFEIELFQVLFDMVNR